MAQDERTEVHINRYRELKKDRLPLDPKYKDIREFIFPGSGMFVEDGDSPHDGEMHNEQIVDGIATRALRIAAAGMQGGLTSPARPWFRLGLEDEELAEYRPIREWLDTVQTGLYNRYARSNFYNSIHQVYQEEIAYAVATMFQLENPRHVVHFVPLTVGEYYLVSNQYGMVDTVFRTVWYQAHLIAKKFTSIPEDIKRELDRKNGNPFKWFKVLHIVQPREKFDPFKRDNLNMQYQSIHILLFGDNPLLEESGFQEQPMVCPRWNTVGNSVYGRGPGHDSLPDVKMLQQITCDLAEGLEKQIRPPLKSGAGLEYEVSHMGGLVTYTENVNADTIGPIFQVNLSLKDLLDTRNDLRMQVREGFFNDLFLMLIEPTPGMTATEVAERQQEKLLILGPVIERQFHELLDPTIDRTFAIMNRKGLIPPPPRELQEMIRRNESLANIKVQYISLLAQAQKLVTTQSIKAVSDYVGGMSQIFPDVVDKLDADQAVDEFAAATGAPAKIVRSDDMVAEIRREKMKQVAEAKQMQMEQAQAQQAKTLSETDISGDNALNELRNSMEAI